MKKETNSIGNDKFDLIQIAKALLDKIWLIGITTILGAALAFMYSVFFISPTYQASTLMYVNSSDLSLGNLKLSVSDIGSSGNLMNFYMVILKSRGTLNAVIEEAEVPYSSGQLSGMISASSESNTSIFRIYVTAPNPYDAEKIANTIAYVLPEKISEIVDGSSARVVDYAVVPSTKSGPNVTRNTTIGLLAGAAFGALIILALYLLDDKIHGGDYLTETYDIPVLAEIPDLANVRSSARYGKYGKYGKYGTYGGYEKSAQTAENKR